MIESVKRALTPTPEPDIPELPAVGLTTDDLHHLLRVRRRREAVRYVDDCGPTPIGELADYVTAIETGKHIEDITTDDRKKVYVGLHQSHLPQLVEHGVLTEQRGIVSPTDQTAAVAEIARRIDDATAEVSGE